MNRLRIARVALSLLNMLVAATVHAQTSAEVTAIRKVRAEQNAAILRKDFVAVANAWTDDVTTRAGLGRDIHGKPAYLAAFVADSAMSYKREPTDIVTSAQWPLAFERGKWTGQLRSAPGAPMLSGEYSAQWVKTAAGWRIRSELFVALTCAGVACQWPAIVP